MALFRLGVAALERCAGASMLAIASRVQVIYGVWSVLPPLTWFIFDNPIPFALVACLVLALSAAAAWLQGKFWDAVVNGFGQKRETFHGDKVDMHARAGKAE